MLTVIQGDCREILKTLPDESAHCCVTSPPYFGLRDYGTAQWEGGSAECDHLLPPNGVRDKGRDRAASNGTFHDSPIANQIPQQFSRACAKCGALRIDSQIGLELTPDAYVAQLVEVFREVRRVLRSDGTLWLNLGDSYAGSWGAQSHMRESSTNSKRISGHPIVNHPRRASHTGTIREAGLKPKDLIGIPWRVAFALQADGWYLRSDIIWSKPNPMPESVTDRPTKAHEYLFLLAKAERYYYDAGAIAEPAINAGQVNNGHGSKGQDPVYQRTAVRGQRIVTETRNRRTVWEIPTRPYPEAHFATFPEDLARPCILAGAPAGGTVIDPFAGSGTAGRVALSSGRRAILIELNPPNTASL